VDGSNDSPERLRSWLLLGLVTATNPSRRREFHEAYGDLGEAVAASEKDWPRFGLLRPSGANDIFAAGSRGVDGSEAWAARQLESSARLGATIVTLEDRRYPAWLRTISDPPVVLHVRGSAGVLSRASIGIVGARRATNYGLDTAGTLARDLSLAGISIVSGGARGIDTAAHRGALDAGGTTVAVMGSGLDVPYPEENGKLFERIAETGAVVSEFAFGTAPLPRHFPFRNRVIAGLSLGVVVVEGARESGSLITAALAAEGGREVFAVPGPITSRLSAGPNRLIQDGAKLVSGAGDVLEELPDGVAGDGQVPQIEGGVPATAAAGAGGPHDREILERLEIHQGISADELSAAVGIATGELLGALLEMELRGLVHQMPGGRFVRRG
jgi:DNA processing protein